MPEECGSNLRGPWTQLLPAQALAQRCAHTFLIHGLVMHGGSQMVIEAGLYVAGFLPPVGLSPFPSTQNGCQSASLQDHVPPTFTRSTRLVHLLKRAERLSSPV